MLALTRAAKATKSKLEEDQNPVPKQRAQRISRRFKARFMPQIELTSQPDHALIDVITVPRADNDSPWKQLGSRVLWAFALLVFVTVVVYFDGDGYSLSLIHI